MGRLPLAVLTRVDALGTDLPESRNRDTLDSNSHARGADSMRTQADETRDAEDPVDIAVLALNIQNTTASRQAVRKEHVYTVAGGER